MPSSVNGDIRISIVLDDSDMQNDIRSVEGLTTKLKNAFSKLKNAIKNAFSTKEIKDVKRETKKTTEQTEKYGKTAQNSGKASAAAFSKVSAVIVAATVAIVATLKKVTQEIITFSSEAATLATETEASTLRLVDIYGKAASALGAYIDANAHALGMSRAAAASFSAVYGNLFSTWADQATNAELTANYLNMTAVVASKTGRTMADVQERIRSGLLGNTEAVEDLGIFVNVKTIEMTKAFQKLAGDKSWEQLGAAEQIQIRTLAILEQATQKYGAEVADTASLTKAQYTAAYEEFKNTWGKIVNMVLVPALRVATDVLNTLTLVMQLFAGISGKTVEGTTDALNGAIKKQEELTDEVGETEKALKKATAGFDELNILSSGSKTATGSADTGGQAPVISPETMGEIVGIEFNLTSNISEFAADIGLNKDKILGIISPLRTEFVSLGGEIKTVWTGIYTNILVPFGNWFVEDFSPEYITTVAAKVGELSTSVQELGDTLNKVSDEDLEPIFEKIGSIFTTVSTELLDTFNMTVGKIIEYGDTIGFVVNIILSTVNGLISNVFFFINRLVQPLMDFFLDLGKVVQSFFGIFQEAFFAVKSALAGDVDGIKEHLQNMLLHFGNWIIASINMVIDVINLAISGLVAAIIPVINLLGSFADVAGDVVGKDWGWQLGADDVKYTMIPQIPYLEIPKLAQGAVIPPNREFLAVLGDQKSGTNIEAPADLIESILRKVVREENGSGSNEAILEIDGEKFGRLIYKLNKQQGRRVGVNFSEG